MPFNDTLPWLDDNQFHAWRVRVRAEHAAGNLTPARRDALTKLLKNWWHAGAACSECHG